jgi:hypothetical protein
MPSGSSGAAEPPQADNISTLNKIINSNRDRITVLLGRLMDLPTKHYTFSHGKNQLAACFLAN